MMMDSQSQPSIPLIRIESDSSIEKISATPPPPHEDVFYKALRASLLRATAGDETVTLTHFKVAFTSQEFLQLLFRLLDEDGDQFIDQDWLVARLNNRLTGEKEAHLSDVLTTAIHAHAFDQLIGIETFGRIFRTKELLDRVYRVIDLDGDGLVYCTQVMEFIANLTNAKPRTCLTAENLVHLEKLFRETTRGGDEIHLEDFRKIVKSKNIFFTERVFKVFDRDGSGTVSLQEFLDAITKFSGQSPDDKINFLFRIYDLDGDGLIQHNELRHVMNACMEENGMRFSDDQIDDLTTALFEDADPNSTGAITFEALKAQLNKHQGLLENLSTSIERWLVPPQPEKRRSFRDRWRSYLPHWLHWRFVSNNYVYLSFLTGFVAINIALFITRVYQFRESNGFYILARASGFCLNFTCTMLLVFMLRNLLTWLRSHGASAYLPLDEHIHFHKMTGILVAVYSAIHTAMHIANFHILAASAPPEVTMTVTEEPQILTFSNTTVTDFWTNSTFGEDSSESQESNENVTDHDDHDNNKRVTFTVVEWMFTSLPGKFGLVPGWAAITGDLLVLVLLIMVLCSLRCVRKNGKFEVFYWTHQLFVVFWILLILHAPNFWKWFVVPAAIYIVERIVRFIRVGTGHGRTIITEGVLLPSKVTHLVIKRPQSFIYHPGDYIFVRIPAIARSEWHPFTLSSAPEQEDFLWLHIRAVGEWTNRLHEYVDAQRQRMSGYEVSISCTPTPGITSVSSIGLQSSNGFPNKLTMPSTPMGSTSILPLLDVPQKSVRILDSPQTGGYDNLSYESETNLDSASMSPAATPASGSPSPVRLLRARPLHKPLTSSRSMPDVEARVKEREKRFRDREHSRSASEKAFDEQTLRRARDIQANGGSRLGDGLTCTTVYRRHRDSMAQSFKYLRHKPMTIQLSPVPEPRGLESVEPDEESAVTPSKAPSIRKKSSLIPPSRDDLSIMTATAVMGKPLEVYIDGPFGAPSSHIFRAQHAVLVATGIGVTPFASILQSIMRRYWAERHTCPRCSYAWTGDIPRSVMNLKKVDFFWINRDQRSFEWFVNLLSQLEIEQAELGGAMERFLDMHMYITSALQRADMKALGLQLALDLLHEREKRDLITGLKTRTQAGRPNWNKVFKQIADQRKGKVTVFYCGPPELGRMLQVRCDEFGFTFRKEVF